MASTPEAKVKAAAVKTLKQIGAYYFFPVLGGYSVSGVPDIVGCIRGRFFGIECKSGGNKPTALQNLNLQRIRDSGGVALVINESNVHLLAQMLLREESSME